MAERNRKKNILETIFRLKFVIYVALLTVIYFVTTDLVTNADVDELKKWRIPDISKIIEPVKIMIQAAIAAIIAITIFYMGKFHDFNRDYIGKLGEFEEAVIRFNQSSKSKTKKNIEIAEKTEHFETKLEFQKYSPGLTIGMTFVLLIFFSYQFVKIFYNNFDDIKENFLYVISLGSSVAVFFLHWSHLDYMLTNRQEFYKELVSDTAKLKSVIH